MRWLKSAMLAGVLMSAPATAQTTQPAAEVEASAEASSQSDWPTVVQQFQSALTRRDIGAVNALLSNVAHLRRFNSHDSADPATLVNSAGGIVLGGHAYIYPPLVMAADVAADFKSSPLIPEPDKKKMVPRDDDEMKRANATAAQWIRQVLNVEKGDPVGVIVAWRATEQPREGEPVLGEPVFVLFRGKETENSFKITQLVFGNPQPSNDP